MDDERRPKLASDNYGKSGIRLVKVVRDGPRHTLHDLTVDVRVEGDFLAAHLGGDNSSVLPTDTMKNTVYALARTHDVDPPERFCGVVGAHVLESSPNASRVTVEIARHGWGRIAVGGRPHETAFERGSAEARVACVSTARGGPSVTEAGVRDLIVLRTAGSAFSGFPRDEFTTLRETRDRVFATTIASRWTYRTDAGSHNTAFVAVRRALVEMFATHVSESVQHTLYAMGEAALVACADIEEIRLSMPNKHHLLVDLAAFGLENPNEIFVATTEPYGLIEATLSRGE